MHLQGFAHVWSKGGFRQKKRLAATHEKTISCAYSFFMELQKAALSESEKSEDELCQSDGQENIPDSEKSFL